MRRALTALLCLPVLLTACSSSSGAPPEPDLPDEGDFQAGACRTAAPGLLTLGRTLPRLGDGPELTQDVQDVLREVQDDLVRVVEVCTGAR